MLPERRRTLLATVVGLVLVMCLASTAVCVASPLVLPRLPMPFGTMMSVCAVFQSAPRFRLGVTWNSPFLSSAPPPAPPALRCTLIPWLPALSQRGAIIFPS
jgi:hypothetical protein